MLDTSLENWQSELSAWEADSEKKMSARKQMVESYRGPYWESTEGQALEDWDVDPENVALEWQNIVGPQLSFNNPRVKTGSRRNEVAMDDISKAAEMGANRWVVDTNMRTLNEELQVDYGFNFFVAYVTREPAQGSSGSHKDPRLWPAAARIAPEDYIYDPVALGKTRFRYQGHVEHHDKEDLEWLAKNSPEDGWNLEAIKLLQIAGSDELRRQAREDTQRDEVSICRIWVPEVFVDPKTGEVLEPGAEHDHKTWGSIWTVARKQQGGPELADSSPGDYIKRPEPFFGPRWGPYTLAGDKVVPDEAIPLGPLVSVWAQVQALNEFTRSMLKALANYKRLIIVGGGHLPNAEGSGEGEPVSDLAQTVKDGKNDYVYVHEGLLEANQILQFEIAGATEQHIIARNLLRELVDKVTGIYDAMRGNVTGDATATENALANNASETRLASSVQKFRDGVTQIIKTVVWYLLYDDRMLTRLGPNAAGQFEDEEGQPIDDAVLVGGAVDKVEGFDFDDLELEIEPYSMERVTDATLQRRAAELDNIVAIAPSFPQIAPWFDIKRYLELRGDALNMPQLAELVNVEELLAYAQAEQEAEFARTEQPMLGRQGGTTGPMGGGRPARPQVNQGESLLEGARTGAMAAGDMVARKAG